MGKKLDDFKDMIRLRTHVFLDTETTDLKDGEICQIAIIDAYGVVLMDTYVKTTYSIPPSVTRFHGISDETVAHAPTWSGLTGQIQSILAGRDVVTYNATFDRMMMHQSAEKAGLPKIEWKELATWHCAMLAYAEFYGDWNNYHKNYRWQTLSSAVQQCGLPPQSFHTALGDCLATLSVCQAMLK